MKFSRSHTGMIAIVSIFTGMIAPVVSSPTRSYPFPLTDMQLGAYIILLLLVFGFYFASISRWRVFGFFGGLLIVLIGYLLYMSITGGVHDSVGNSIDTLSWGWIFLGIGSFFIIHTIFSREPKQTKATLFIDHIIGIIGSGTLVCLLGLIIMVSYTRNPIKNHDDILLNFFGTGQVKNLSGITASPAFSGIRFLEFERKNNNIRFVASSGSIHYLFPGGKLPEKDINSVFAIGNKTVVSYTDGTFQVDGITKNTKGIVSVGDKKSIMEVTTSGNLHISESGEIFFPGSHQNINSLVRDNSLSVAWIESKENGFVAMRNNEAIGNIEKSISAISISADGKDLMTLVETNSGGFEIYKNGVRIESVLPGYMSGTFHSNGNHSIYVKNSGGIKSVIYDGSILNNQFEEVREIFLEKDGDSYAFFARPIGDTHYCIFTRYHGNLCGLDGYMNPRFAADGETILYAGLKDELWSIYRNTNTVIKDTQYRGRDIQNDYVFFDITNPKQYLFIEKMRDGTYLYRKNGKVLPGNWKDVSLDVWFGYDSKIITAAQDVEGWRVIEM